MNNIILNCTNLARTFGSGDITTEVLCDVNLQVVKSERVAIVGPSGSGKSTLLHLLGGLDVSNSGTINMVGNNFSTMNTKQITLFRNKHLGFIYQFHHLLPEFNAIENVAMPLWIANIAPNIAQEQAIEMLTKVGLSHRLTHRPAELSGGERQRVAIARAMVHQPEIILADEPTGNLDTESANNVFELMNELNISFGTTLIMVTHAKSLATRMDRVLILQDKTLK